MNVSDKFRLALSTLLFVFVSGTAFAQAEADDEADVILTIEEQWNAEQKGDKDWIDERLVSDFSGVAENFSGTAVKIVDENVEPLWGHSR